MTLRAQERKILLGQLSLFEQHCPQNCDVKQKVRELQFVLVQEELHEFELDPLRPPTHY